MKKAVILFIIGAAIAAYSLAFMQDGDNLGYALTAIVAGTALMFLSLFVVAHHE